LTEVKLTVKNKAQPFLKLELPAGASILSADVAGEKVKPVQGADGSRVPLLRAGFRPSDAYEVSFVFLHAGAPFEKKGDAELTLPKMDIPIGQMQWEVFLPQRYKVANFAGDAVSALLLRQSSGADASEASLDNAASLSLPVLALGSNAETIRAGVLGGIVVDPSGAVVRSAAVEVRMIGTGATYQAMSDASGRWAIANLPAGRMSVMVTVRGFITHVRELDYNPARVTVVNAVLQVGQTAETVTVTAESPRLMTESAELSGTVRAPRLPPLPVIPPSTNVSNLQQRVAGVLPISVNVPRTGNSYQFARALVMDEETKLTFKYRR
jgi:primosomal replication protein N